MKLSDRRSKRQTEKLIQALQETNNDLPTG